MVAGEKQRFSDLVDLIRFAWPGKTELTSLAVIFIIGRAHGADCALLGWGRSERRWTTWQALWVSTRRQRGLHELLNSIELSECFE